MSESTNVKLAVCPQCGGKIKHQAPIKSRQGVPLALRVTYWCGLTVILLGEIEEQCHYTKESP